VSELLDRFVPVIGEQAAGGEGSGPSALDRFLRTLILDDLPLFLDDQHCCAALREFGQPLPVHGPDEPWLVEPDTQPPARFSVDSQIGKCLADIQESLTGADNG